eukprot:TRINITY_DN3329_c0_g1_i7.p2 TRINITY_DN3329_c0_g1~~TRINITY_DN3329_c0_g1_i7.p2  ORF type:complete len:107 (+),score=49.48 TRINITY_DN3329_c0_g1_i7:217-537(+)
MPMALPPVHVYSAVVKNAGETEVKVAATYNMPDGTTAVEEITIAGGAEGRLSQKTIEQGTITTTGHIAEVKMSSAKGQSAAAAPFKVDSPTRNYVFTVGEDLSIHH